MKVQEIKVELGERSYNVSIGTGIYGNLGHLLRSYYPPGKLLLVTDSNVGPLYAGKCKESLEEAGFKPYVKIIPAGEESKEWGIASSLYDAAIEAGLDRRSPIAALGGGVVGDVAGFVSSTYLRGVPFVQLPTTLLAQVDSSVGGKVAINHPRGKNLIGTFYQPDAVLIDLETLQTLPTREVRAGAAEVIKYGVIWDRHFWSWLEQELPRLLRLHPYCLAEAVSRSVQIKAEIVRRDEREKGLRRLLNYGHTWGHALEAVTQYRYYLHGEAVLVGMALAAELAVRMDVLPRSTARRLNSLYGQLGYRELPPGLTAGKILQALQYDKKREGEELVFVLPEVIGRAGIYRGVPYSLIREVTEDYLAGRII